MDEVVDKFRSRGVVSGGALYLTVPDGYDFIAAVEKSAQVILGVEAVRLESGQVRPLLGQIADFSSLRAEEWSSRVMTSVRAAAGFLDQLPKQEEIRVTFTIATHAEDSR